MSKNLQPSFMCRYYHFQYPGKVGCLFIHVLITCLLRLHEMPGTMLAVGDATMSKELCRVCCRELAVQGRKRTCVNECNYNLR